MVLILQDSYAHQHNKANPATMRQAQLRKACTTSSQPLRCFAVLVPHSLSEQVCEMVLILQDSYAHQRNKANPATMRQAQLRKGMHNVESAP